MRPMTIGLVATGVMVMARGVLYGIGDHSELIPIIRHLSNPDAYRGDYVLGSISGYSTVFYFLCGLSRPSEAGLKMLFLAGTVLLAAAGLVLIAAYSKFQESTLAEAWLATLALALGYNPSLGHSFFDLALSHALPGIVLGLLALLLQAQGRALPAYAIAGVMLNVHGMYALMVLGILLISTLLDRPIRWERLIGGPLLALVLGLPILVMHAREPSSDVPMAQWLTVLRIRDTMHIFLGDVGRHDWVAFATFLALLARPWRASGERLGARSMIPAGLLIAALGLIAAIVFIEWHAVAAVVRLHPLRGTFWLYLASLPVWARSVLEGLRVRDTRLAVAVVLISLFQQPLSLKVLALGYVGVSLLLRRARPEALLWAGAAYVSAVVVMLLGRSLFHLAGRTPPAMWPVTGYHTVAVLLMIGFAAFSQLGTTRGPIMIGVLCAAGGLLARSGSVLRGQEALWVDVQRWARQATPPGATFVVPVYLEGFRIHSWRNQYVDWRDGTLGNFSPTFARLWWQRMTSLGFDFNLWAEPERALEVYRELDAPRLCALAAADDMDYVVTEDSEQMSDLPLVYSNDRFYVRRLACGRSQENAGRPVSASPRMSAWMSWVPS